MDYSYKVTTNGRKLLAACMDLEKPLKITRVAVGKGTVAEGTDLADVHELVEYVADAYISARSHENDYLKLTIQYVNSKHKDVKMFYLAEFIVYAENPDKPGTDLDLLYATLGDYAIAVPAYTPGAADISIDLALVMVVSSDVEVALDTAAALVTHSELESAISKISMIIGIGPPTTETPGNPGQHYIDTAAGKEYTCYGETDAGCQWKPVGSGDADAATIREIIESEIAGLAGARLTLAFTLPADDWHDGSGNSDYPWYCNLENDEITTAMVPQVTLDEDSQPTAAAAGMCACVRTYDGGVRFLAAAKPGAALSGVCCLTEKVMFSGGGIEFTLDGDWQSDTGSAYPYYYDLTGLAISEELVPQVVFDEASQIAAAAAGVSASVSTYDNYARFRAMEPPEAALSGVLYLLGRNSGGSGGGDGSGYTLPTATKTRLGGVKAGAGVSVAADGTISVDSESIAESVVGAVIEKAGATDAELEEALDESWGDESTRI